MDVYERIVLLLYEKGMNKREFATKLRSLEPRLKSTGEAPSEKTIYGYLAGRISIGIELIPYIAQVLGVTEQELFFTDFDKRIDFYKRMLMTATDEELEMIQQKLQLKNKINTVIDPDNDIPQIIDPLIEKLQELKRYIS
jgi:transcriptional regulator with XRE-family HTH domain